MKNSKLHQENKQIVSQLIKKNIKDNKIVLAILGGSVARGDETEHSDIDINFFSEGKYLPNEKRKFYRFKRKYIEESFHNLSDFNINNLLDEEVILYDKKNLAKNRKSKN